MLKPNSQGLQPHVFHAGHNLLMAEGLGGVGHLMDIICVFVFNPKWDMHWLRAKEIKDSPNSQAVPKILVLLKMALPGSTTGSGSSYFSNTQLHD